MRIRLNDRMLEFPEGSSLQEIASEVSDRYDALIVLARVNDALKELNKVPADGDRVEFITISEKAGSVTYQRSLLFLLLKAFHDCLGREAFASIYVDYSLSNGLYLRMRNRKPDPVLIEQVKARMEVMIREDLPFIKETLNTREAIRRFGEMGMPDKVSLFRYRRSSFTNIYRLGDYIDYNYAYMVPSTGFLKYFDLFAYEEGMILQHPDRRHPNIIRPYLPQPKLYRTLKASTDWSEKLNLRNVGELNNWISNGETAELILLQEAQMEHEIGRIAEEIVSSGKRLVLIAGPSSSGKTTFSHRLSVHLRSYGRKTHPIACDNYFKARSEYPVLPDGSLDYEALVCVDTETLNQNLNGLISGETVQTPRFNFITGEPEYKGDTLRIGPKDILVLEGIHCLNDELTADFPAEFKYKIYISALTAMNVDEHNRIATTDERLLRRIVRDARTRGTSARETIKRWDSVRRGEEDNIFPFQESADVMFNSALIYELAALKPYAEPLLFNIPEDAPEYTEAKRLLKFLEYFLTIPSESIPTNSLVREFIGGGCFDL